MTLPLTLTLALTLPLALTLKLTSLEKYPTSVTNIFACSVTDAGSLVEAERLLQGLWQCGDLNTKAVIVVGNKIDLVRNREVPIHGQRGKHHTVYCTFTGRTKNYFNVNILMSILIISFSCKLGNKTTLIVYCARCDFKSMICTEYLQINKPHMHPLRTIYSRIQNI